MNWLNSISTITNAGMLIIVIGYTLVGAIVTYFIMADRAARRERDEYLRGYADHRDYIHHKMNSNRPFING